MTITVTHYTTGAKGYVLQTDKLQGDMSQADFTQLENEALSYEAIMTRDEKVWTMDSASAAIAPRGKRPTS